MTQLFEKNPFVKTNFERLTIPVDFEILQTKHDNFKLLSKSRLRTE